MLNSCLACLCAGLVEAWAAGASWQEVMADTSLDDGDMARLLARTADMLKQVRGPSTCVQRVLVVFGSTLLCAYACLFWVH